MDQQSDSIAGPARTVTPTHNRAIFLDMTQKVVPLATQGGLRRFLIYLRSHRGWDQTRLAEAVGRSQPWVSKFERGQTEPSLADVMSALTALGADIVVRPITAPQKDDNTDG